MQVQLHTFLTSTTGRGEGSALHYGCYTTHMENIKLSNTQGQYDAMEKENIPPLL
jgi:hypothetical protein